MGTVYLIHFARKLSHAQHYLGYTGKKKVAARMDAHRRGQGSKLMRAVTEAGIAWDVCRVWKDETRTFERGLKKRKGTAKLCPVCNPAALRYPVAAAVKKS